MPRPTPDRYNEENRSGRGITRMKAQSKIIIFCGKGGVGKTTLSLALGLKHAAQGRKVLVVSSHPLPELAISVSLEGLEKECPAAARNLFVVHLNPKELLGEVVRNNFPVPGLARAILSSSLYQNLIEVAPGLKEFYFLARLQELAERKAAAGQVPDYDLLLWDAPATGHFLTTLRAARSFEVYLTGPLASAGAELARFFSNASNLTVLPTTTLEEMAIEETIELCRALKSDFRVQAAALVLNLVSPLVTAGDAEAEEVRSLVDSDPALRFALERGLIERERAAALRSAVPAPAVAIERARQHSSDLAFLRHIGESLEALPIRA